MGSNVTIPATTSDVTVPLDLDEINKMVDVKNISPKKLIAVTTK